MRNIYLSTIKFLIPIIRVSSILNYQRLFLFAKLRIKPELGISCE
jgi:hypothetical protein